MENENKKLSLEDLKNEANRVEEEEQQPTKEQVEQQLAAMKAFNNAQAFKQKKMAEFKATEEERKKKQEEEQTIADQEHFQKVVDGEEEADSPQEFFDLLDYDVKAAMERKKAEKQMVEDYYEEKAEEEEAEELANGFVEEKEEEVDELINRDKVETKINQVVVTNKDELRSLHDTLDDIDDDDFDIDDEEDVDVEDIDDLEEDDKDDLDEDEEEFPFKSYTDEEYRDILVKEASKKIKPYQDKIDLSQFKIGSKSVTVKSATRNTVQREANWGLFNSNILITLCDFKGSELGDMLDLLGDESGKLTPYNRNRSIYKMIYDHDNSEGKPEFEQWLKDILIIDNDHLFMGIYRACYAGANYIPYRCEACGEVFVSDDIPLYQMVKYKTPEDEKKAQKVLDQAQRGSVEHAVIREQVSDKYVIDFRIPSLYNIMIETALLDDDFVEKYSNLISYMSYIENVYYINRNTMTLDPIEIDKYDKNLKKQIIMKIKRFYKIFKELSESQLSVIENYITELIENPTVDVEYCIPATKCTRCGKDIPEVVVPSQQLLFTRHQLARLVTI